MPSCRRRQYTCYNDPLQDFAADVIRVSLLIPTLDRSGAEKQLTLLACGLPRPEFDVEVIALDRGGPYAAVLAESDTPVTIIGKRGRFDPGALRRLKAHLRQRRPDILHTWLFAANSYGRMAVDRRTTKVVISERCVDSWKAGWQFGVDRLLASRTDCLIANSRSVADFYAERGMRTPIVVIPNGIELTFPPVGTRDQLLRELELPADARLVCYVGRLAEQKRVDDLLWAAQLLRQAEPRAYFLIVGDGPERARLEQHARDVEVSEHVRWLGHRADAASVLGLCDVFWLGSSFEGMSNSLLEAMSCGRPVVVTDIPPNRELVRHGIEGYLVKIGDGAGFAQFTVRLLADTELSRKIGDAGRERVRRDFSVDGMIEAHVRLYRQLVGPSRASDIIPQSAVATPTPHV
jgi:glycosyltransferase involved in cell wall biosynthesis